MGGPSSTNDADVALRLSQRQGAFQRHKRSRDVALRLVGERLQHQDLDDASRPLACFRCLQEALQESDRLVHGAALHARSGTGPGAPWPG